MGNVWADVTKEKFKWEDETSYFYVVGVNESLIKEISGQLKDNLQCER